MAERDDPASEAEPNARVLAFWHWIRPSESIDRQAVIARVREDAGWSSHFAFMTLMSAGIAMLGLLLSSPAVVIGAMLVSPLMGPIIGLGFAIATFDSKEMRRTATALVIGTTLAVGFCGMVVLLSPLRSLTSEIAARTRPNLFDLLIALFSGLAGTYAMIRGRQGAIVGVAIATALMPPLAVVGYGLATQNWTVLAGSSLLFFTNLMTIAAAAALLGRIYGFAGNLSPHQNGLQISLVSLLLIGLAVPLGLSLKQIAWEALASRETRQIITDQFGDGSRLTDLDIDYQANPIAITATVLTPHYFGNADALLGRRVSRALNRPAQLSIDQLRIDGADRDALELANAKRAAVEKVADRLAAQLALAAGVSPDQVLVDRVHRRMAVRAAILPGATLQSYRELEARVAAVGPEWSISLVPPVLPLGAVNFNKTAASATDDDEIPVAVWAARRLRLPIQISGGTADQRGAVANVLEKSGVDTQVTPRNGRALLLSWVLPTIPQAIATASPRTEKTTSKPTP